MNTPFGAMGGQNKGMSPQEQQTIRMMQGAFESCVVKTAMSGAAGKINTCIDLTQIFKLLNIFFF